jgi:hypothetical protein
MTDDDDDDDDDIALLIESQTVHMYVCTSEEQLTTLR